MSYRIPTEVKQEVITLFASGIFTKKQLAEKFNLKRSSVVELYLEIRTATNNQ